MIICSLHFLIYSFYAIFKRYLFYFHFFLLDRRSCDRGSLSWCELKRKRQFWINSIIPYFILLKLVRFIKLN
jgi:hypothetical protein